MLFRSHTPPPVPPPPDDARTRFFWTVSALWTAVFLGALDGASLSLSLSSPPSNPVQAPSSRPSSPPSAATSTSRNSPPISGPPTFSPSAASPPYTVIPPIALPAKVLTLIRSSIRHFRPQGRNASRLVSIRCAPQIALRTRCLIHIRLWHDRLRSRPLNRVPHSRPGDRWHGRRRVRSFSLSLSSLVHPFPRVMTGPS